MNGTVPSFYGSLFLALGHSGCEIAVWVARRVAPSLIAINPQAVPSSGRSFQPCDMSNCNLRTREVYLAAQSQASPISPNPLGTMTCVSYYT